MEFTIARKENDPSGGKGVLVPATDKSYLYYIQELLAVITIFYKNIIRLNNKTERSMT